MVEGYRVEILLRLAAVLGVRMCPRCPRCNDGDGLGCQDRFGSNMRPMGGVLGGMWTVFSTLASHANPLDPLVLLFYFHLGEVAAAPPTLVRATPRSHAALSLPLTPPAPRVRRPSSSCR